MIELHVGRHIVGFDRSEGSKWTVLIDGSAAFEIGSGLRLSVGPYSVAFWSENGVVVFDAARAEPSIVEFDDEFRVLYEVDGHWLVVCESSLHLIGPSGSISRYELPDVVLDAKPTERGAALTLFGSRHLEATLSGERLEFNAREDR